MEPRIILENVDSLQAFILRPKDVFGSGLVAHFKYHDEHEAAFVSDPLGSPGIVAETRRAAVLFFLLAYAHAMVQQRIDEEGWQYWTLELDAVDPTQRYDQIRRSIEITRLVEASSAPPLRRPRSPKK